MMLRYRYLAVATLAALAGTLPMAGAVSAADPVPAADGPAVLTNGAGGADLAVGDVISAALKAGTTVNFFSSASGSTGVRCAVSTFSATVDSNPVAPGTAEETLTAQNFSSCTSNIFGTTGVRGVTVNNLPFHTTVDSATKSVTVTGSAAGPIRTTAVLNTILGTVTCVYEADGNTLTGTAANDDNSITFTGQKFNKVSGPATCFGNGYFSATYSPVQNSSAPDTPGVYVN
ncbi:Tat pathway signal sequence domain protein [Planosporangium sp. 12N6]|uniref:Tat pathway signal sequence domain protein n=1 Tax=Planosporangium spinosum TaxID=3402278 RepID=UPI003CEC7C59